jgi:hypothetical protein
MGLNFPDTQLLMKSYLAGHRFARTLTIGRLSLNLHRGEIRQLLKLSKGDRAVRESLSQYSFRDYVDRFLREGLGATHLDVLDYSPYEGATLQHDLNKPVPAEWLARYDVVIEAGSLEHVFDVATALKNVMGMVRVGGLLLMKSPTNNLCGHGFYQFSPELMFRALSRANGYVVERSVMIEAQFPSVEIRPMRRAYEVVDPELVGRRVGLVNKRPVELIVLARRLSDDTIFATPPLQSDYVATWKHGASKDRQKPSWMTKLFAMMPPALQGQVMGIRQRRAWSWSNRRAFRRIRPEDI